MKNDPSIIIMSPEWLQSLSTIQTEYEPGKWGPARPIGFASIFYRLKATWLVFTGNADALVWPQDRCVLVKSKKVIEPK